MADNTSLPSSTPTDNTNESPHRVGSIGGMKHTARPQQKVKFSMEGSEEDHQNVATASDLEAGLNTKTIPHSRVPESEDLGDFPLSSPNWTGRTNAAAEHAQYRASRLASRLTHSAPGSRTNSVTNLQTQTTSPGKQHLDVPSVPSIAKPFASQPPLKDIPTLSNNGAIDLVSPYSSPPLNPISNYPVRLDDIPLDSLEKTQRPYDIHEDLSTEEDTDVEEPMPLKWESHNMEEARRLISALANHGPLSMKHESRSGTQTPAADKHLHDLDYVPKPDHYKPGILGAILSSKLTELQRNGISHPDYSNPYSLPPAKKPPKDIHGRKQERCGSDTGDPSPQSSGRATPSRRKKWYDQETPTTSSTTTLLAHAAVASAAPGAPRTSSLPGSGTSGPLVPSGRPGPSRPRSSGMIANAVDIIKHPKNHLRSRSDMQPEIPHETIREVADIIARRKYLAKICSALMLYGAPTHRLEEYMRTSARALQVEAEFLYMPGSMLCCFVDSITYSTQVEMVRQAQGVDLGKFKDVFNVYKCVIHHVYDAEEGLKELDLIMKSNDLYPIWSRILAFGIAAVTVSPWAFSARPIDFGPIFVLGTLLGVMQLFIVPRSEQFSHVFEVAASVLTSFVARGLGSIMTNGKPLFCFAAMAQSSIALILPGYIILCAALELQSKNMVSGSVRMVFAIIYTLFLGFGLLIGTTLFGLIYPHAISSVTCDIPAWWDASRLGPEVVYVKFIWVPIFSICLAIINQANWRQMPVMSLIAFSGYQANFWVSTRIANNIQVANAIGAFIIGAMANLYSRFFHGLAAAAMLPAIFVQVPSGLAASGSLVAGITSANQITGNATGISVINNGTQGFLNAQNSTTRDNGLYGGTIFNVGYGMVQVAIGISVGLYLSALFVYPYGKRKSGLFSF